MNRHSLISSKPWAVVAAAALLLLLATPAVAQDAGPPSGNGVVPQFWPGNPDCADIGLAFGFKIDGSPNGTFPMTSGNGSLTGGAPEDPGNSITISNSDGSTFDWASTLGVDAVIVKGGPNANVFAYLPEEIADTVLHAPINASNGNPYGLSHIEFCYDYEVSVSKDAATTFTRTGEWDIIKSVNPEAWEIFNGDTGTSKYMVQVSKTGHVDSGWAVSGGIHVDNNTPFDTLLTGISDLITGGIAPAVDCGVGFPIPLAAGETLDCTYATPLPDGTDRVNTATVTTTGVVGGGQATAPVVFGAPTTEVNAEVNVTDTNGMSWGPVADDTAWMYDRTFACGGDAGSHGNVATIVETGQTDNASVTVACHGLSVTKDASTSFDRDWDWDLVKTGDVSQVLLAPGQVYSVGYHVEMSAVPVDSDWAVSGNITVHNPHPTMSGLLLSVGDEVSIGHAMTVNCPALLVPAGGSLACTYEGALPDGTSRTNVATATQQNHDHSYAGPAVPAGTTDVHSASVPVVFGDPDQVSDACIDVDDSLAGALGTMCVDQLPGGFDYSHEVGPFSSPDECGLHEIVNTASFLAGDSGETGDSSWTVDVEVPCPAGCTLTPGYWKTHSEHGPAPYDDTWAQLPGGADTVFFLSGQSWYEMLWTAPKKGNAYYILGHAYAAASLNFLNGASAPPEVMDAWNEATGLFETWTPDEIGALKGNRPPRPRFLELAGLLDMYNNGLLGPGHCSEDDSSAP